MNIYLVSLLLYAIPANLIAGAIMFFARKRVNWLPGEYVLIYLTWLMFVALAVLVFGGLEEATAQLGISASFQAFLFALAGLLGGLTLLPRLFFTRIKVERLLVTSISAFLFAITYVKLVIIIFIFFMPDPSRI